MNRNPIPHPDHVARGQQPVRTMQIHHRDLAPTSGPGTGSMRASWTTVGSFIGAVHGVVAIVLGLAMASLLGISIEEASPPEDGTITTAVVVGWVEGSALIDNISRPTYSPVYEFQDASGTTHRVTDRISPGGSPPTVGSTVEISYVDGDPQSVRRTGLVASWMRWLFRGGVIVAGGGVLLTCVSLMAGARSLRGQRRLQSMRRSPFVG